MSHAFCTNRRIRQPIWMVDKTPGNANQQEHLRRCKQTLKIFTASGKFVNFTRGHIIKIFSGYSLNCLLYLCSFQYILKILFRYSLNCLPYLRIFQHILEIFSRYSLNCFPYLRIFQHLLEIFSRYSFKCLPYLRMFDHILEIFCRYSFICLPYLCNFQHIFGGSPLPHSFNATITSHTKFSLHLPLLSPPSPFPLFPSLAPSPPFPHNIHSTIHCPVRLLFLPDCLLACLLVRLRACLSVCLLFCLPARLPVSRLLV
jgi:hypothetical protein